MTQKKVSLPDSHHPKSRQSLTARLGKHLFSPAEHLGENAEEILGLGVVLVNVADLPDFFGSVTDELIRSFGTSLI